MTKAAHAGAIAMWRRVLGEAHVAEDEATLGEYSRTTAPRWTRPCCILYPRSTEDVQAIVRVASQFNVPLYPISRGKNWGYGDACAPGDGYAIIVFNRMNRIIELNRELAYVVIEPGVSQGQLYEYLRAHAPDLWMDATGAGMEASVVGNALERGFGHSRYSDHVLSIGAMEVVLGDGRVVRTGLSHYENAQAAHVYQHGVGPSLQGLFHQSNVGIVTRVTLFLPPKPECFSFFYLTIEDPTGIGGLVEALRPQRMGGWVQSAVHIGNDLRLLSSMIPYPWEAVNEHPPLPPDLRAALRRQQKVGAWNLSGSLTGPTPLVRAQKRALRKALRGVGRVRFINDRTLALGEMLTRWLPIPRLAQRVNLLRPYYDLLKGKSADIFVRGAQWRLRRRPEHDPAHPPDPQEVGCGLLWVSPVLPATGEAAETVVNEMEPIFNRHGFDLPVTFTLAGERTLICVMSIMFDKSLLEETAQAQACYDEALDRLFALGFVPYRASAQSMDVLWSASDTFWDVSRRIKRALDPQEIIAPGRYIPPAADE